MSGGGGGAGRELGRKESVVRIEVRLSGMSAKEWAALEALAHDIMF